MAPGAVTTVVQTRHHDPLRRQLPSGEQNRGTERHVDSGTIELHNSCPDRSFKPGSSSSARGERPRFQHGSGPNVWRLRPARVSVKLVALVLSRPTAGKSPRSANLSALVTISRVPVQNGGRDVRHRRRRSAGSTNPIAPVTPNVVYQNHSLAALSKPSR